MFKKRFKIFKTHEFEEWFEQQAIKEQEQIRNRMSLIELEGYFGDYKPLSKDNRVLELRWKNGRRIYFAYFLNQNILLLLGGNKNGQNYDIKKAQQIYKRETKN